LFYGVKSIFNHYVHKGGTKYTKVNPVTFVQTIVPFVV
jgi:hypothetical protein